MGVNRYKAKTTVERIGLSQTIETCLITIKENGREQ